MTADKYIGAYEGEESSGARSAGLPALRQLEAGASSSRRCHEWVGQAHLQAETLILSGKTKLSTVLRWRDAPERLQIPQQTSLIHEIFGNPFSPVVLDPRWVTSTVTSLARTIYETRDFRRMPILADALMDAGCAEEVMLNHCQNEPLHTRGCWLIDLLLDQR
jgi:hypothetical protein